MTKAVKYDVIMLGVGSMGSSACWWLAKSGYKVLGLEQFSSPHTEGAHAGQSRIIRKAYFEHPDYVPLLNRAYNNWQQLEAETGEQVFFKTGLVYYGAASHPVMKGVRYASQLHGIPVAGGENMFSQFQLPPGFESIYEPDAGFLQPEKSISLLKQQAIRYGASVQENVKVTGWEKQADGIKVTTDRGSFFSKKLIITAGAWAGKLVPQVNNKLKITRQVIVWATPKNKEHFVPENFPCWLVADDKRPGALYGFPYLDTEKFGGPSGLKFAWHHAADETDPDHVNREITNAEVKKLLADVSEHIPAVADMGLSAAKTCLYANTPDEDFIIDHLPGYDGDVVIACGFSGHGFKFVSAIGEILKDMAIKGKTDLPVSFLSLARFN